MIKVSTKHLKSLLKQMGIKKVGKLSPDVKVKLTVELTLSGSLKSHVYNMNFISLEGDEWEAQFPRNRPQRAHGTATELATKLRQISEDARAFTVQHESIEEWDKLVGNLQAFMANMGTADDVELSDYGVRGMVGVGYYTHLCPPLMATAFSMEGLNALVNDDLIEATHCVDRGTFWSSPEMMNSRAKGKLSERARTGGIGKANRYESIKEIVADFLVKLKPQQGRGYKKAAIDKVADELQSRYLSQLESCGLKDANLEGTLGQWLRQDPNRFQV